MKFISFEERTCSKILEVLKSNNFLLVAQFLLTYIKNKLNVFYSMFKAKKK